jgi:hypothetical protein
MRSKLTHRALCLAPVLLLAGCGGAQPGAQASAADVDVEAVERIPLRTPRGDVRARLEALGARVVTFDGPAKGGRTHALTAFAARWEAVMFFDDGKTSITDVFIKATSGWTDADTALAVARLERRFGKPAVKDTIDLGWRTPRTFLHVTLDRKDDRWIVYERWDPRRPTIEAPPTCGAGSGDPGFRGLAWGLPADALERAVQGTDIRLGTWVVVECSVPGVCNELRRARRITVGDGSGALELWNSNSLLAGATLTYVTSGEEPSKAVIARLSASHGQPVIVTRMTSRRWEDAALTLTLDVNRTLEEARPTVAERITPRP